MTQTICKVVIPVAGLGTRFLPVTKAIPKEMLPIVDKPLIQYAVEEAVDAGITEFVFITNSNKLSIEKHFQEAFDLEKILIETGKEHYLELLSSLIEKIKINSVIQEKPLGLGHAVLCAKDIIGDNNFVVILPDDLILTKHSNCLQQMLDIYNKSGSAVVAVEQVQDSETEKYGIVSIEPVNVKTGRIKKIIEKPKLQDAPSRFGVVGRYILPGEIFTVLEKIQKGSGGEIQLTDAISELLQKQEFIACQFDGIRYDCGSMLGYLQANVDYGLKHKELGQYFTNYLKSIK